ncbi:MAG TPA: hypothetical protein VHM00_08065 [Caldimonas sp.]|jgi:hypothetical protein|nr:hypothetical protein [Caldimonas sp.]HEX2541023.1 hypothetical protein [Caldimonas sp.]
MGEILPAAAGIGAGAPRRRLTAPRRLCQPQHIRSPRQMSRSASVVFEIVVGSGIALVVVVVAICLRSSRVGGVYSRERTVLFAGMPRKGIDRIDADLVLCTTMRRSCRG